LEHGDKSIQSFKCATGVERGQSSEVEGSLSARKMGDFKNEISSGGNNYELPPASTLALTSVGHDGQYYIVETSHQLEEHGGEDMTCSIDPATGNLILHQGNSNGEDNPSTFGDSEFEYRRNESLTLSELGHDYSQYSVTAEEPDLYQSMTLSSETGNLVEEYQAEEEEEEQMSEIKVSNVTSVAHMVGGSSNSGHLGSSIPLKVLLWSNRKTADLIQCIHSHEHKFKIASKTRTHIWNEISKDMAELGHVDCNRDECNKKWSNLYRTWKKVRSRPRETRRRWQNYDAVSELVKSLAVRNRNKVTSSKKHCTKSSKELVEKLMKDNLAHQEAIKLAEEKFAKKVEKLNLERDSMLKEIKQKLDLAHSKYGSSSKMGSQLNNIMNFRTVVVVSKQWSE
ncbi:Ribonuclease HII, partial [Orchesella cincta]